MKTTNKTSIFSAAILITALFSSACTSNPSSQSNQSNPSNPSKTHRVKAVDMHNSENALDCEGIYQGLMPCASCEGIQTTIVLNADLTFERINVYQGEDDATFSENGTFSWDKNGSIITLKSDGETHLCMLKEGSLVMLDAEGKEVTGELAEMYVLKKIEMGDISGEYVNGIEGKGYFDKLTVKPTSEGNYSVEINSGNAKNGCKFEGEGTLKLNKITIDLKKYNKDMKANMVITFESTKAIISADNSEYTYDLMYFCGGGGSLIGEYTKK